MDRVLTRAFWGGNRTGSFQRWHIEMQTPDQVKFPLMIGLFPLAAISKPTGSVSVIVCQGLNGFWLQAMRSLLQGILDNFGHNVGVQPAALSAILLE